MFSSSKKGFNGIIDLGNQNLTVLPEWLKDQKEVQRINLSGNQLKVLPDWFSEFENLQVLDLRNTGLIELCQNFENLQNLKAIYLRDNSLVEVPDCFRLMPNLETVFLSYNKIEKFPSWFFKIENVSIDGNPIIYPPLEVYKRGVQAIKNYFQEREKGTENLNEAKMLIVGEPGAGKTTLMNKILNENFRVDPTLPSTKGIEIKTYLFKTAISENFRINIWDFGGQEIYHATHQFFLTKRSLYVVLSDNRAEDTDFNYWLETIKLLSDESPVIIVQNEKQDRKRDINEKGIMDRYKTIKRVFSLNLSSNNTKLRDLVSALKKYITELPHIGTELPKIWVDIRKALEEIGETEYYITEAKYLEICERFGMHEKERASFLSDYLHDLGVFLHFKDNAVLKRWVILRPEWGTEAVYKVLDNEFVIRNKGYFNKKDLEKIWNAPMYCDMHDELISLMMRFELCYQLDGENTFIAAQLLNRDKPSYPWDNENNLFIKYTYGFMPKGIITRFIVKMHYYISNQTLVWREGVILERQNTSAEIIETYGAREITIRVCGKNKKEFLAVILDCLDKIHSTYSNIKVDKLIPCNCSECKKAALPYCFEYDYLRKLVDANIFEDRCRNSLKLVSLRALIDDALGNNSISPNTLVYIAYNDMDIHEKKQFDIHINILEKKSKVVLFDKSKIISGKDEKKEMRQQLDVADVIILLISASFLENDWNNNEEMLRALDRSEDNGCLTIPIIIKPCNWGLFNISKLKPILYKNSAIFSNPNFDESLTEAISNIHKSIESFLEKRKKETTSKLLSEMEESHSL